MAPMMAMLLWTLVLCGGGILLEFPHQHTEDNQVPADFPSMLANLRGQNGDIRESRSPFLSFQETPSMTKIPKGHGEDQSQSYVTKPPKPDSSISNKSGLEVFFLR